jgi:hypothetical protein
MDEMDEMETQVNLISLIDITHFFTCLDPVFYNPQGETAWTP